jgi:hypothetical protein
MQHLDLAESDKRAELLQWLRARAGGMRQEAGHRWREPRAAADAAAAANTAAAAVAAEPEAHSA